MHSGKRQGVAAAAQVAALGIVYMQAMSVASGLLITRVIGAADYGLINIARALVLNSHIVVRLGLDVGLQRFLGETERRPAERADRLAQVQQLRLLVLGLSVGVVLVIALGAGEWLERHVYRHPGFALVFLFSALALPGMADLSVLGGVYRGILNLTPSVLTEYVLMPTMRLALIGVLFLVGWRLWAVVGGTTLAALAAAALLARRAAALFAQHGRRIPWRQLPATPVMRYSLVLSVSTVVVNLTRSSDVLLLGHYRATAEVGQYSVAQMAMALVALFGSAVGQTTGPRVASLHTIGDRAALNALTIGQARWIVLMSAPLCAAMIVWGVPALLVFGPGFRLDPAVVALLALNQFAVAVLAPSGWLLSMTGHQRAELYTMFVGLGLVLALGFALVPALGSTGAAASVLASTFVANALRVHLAWRTIGVMPLNWSLLAHALWPLVLAAVAEFVRRRLGGPELRWWEAIALGAAFLFASATLTWRWSLRDAERAALRQRLGRPAQQR